MGMRTHASPSDIGWSSSIGLLRVRGVQTREVARTGSLLFLKELNLAFMPLSSGARPEGSQVSPLACPSVFFAGVQAILSRL